MKEIYALLLLSSFALAAEPRVQNDQELYRHLNHARIPEEAASFLILVKSPLDAWSQLGRGEEWLDYWLISRPFLALNSGSFPLYAFPFPINLMARYDEAEMLEVSQRPELIDQIVRTREFEWRQQHQMPLTLQSLNTDLLGGWRDQFQGSHRFRNRKSRPPWLMNSG